MRSSIFAALLTLGLFAPSLAAADSPAFDLGIGTWYADLPDFAYATDATGGPLWFSPVDDAGWIANGELTMRFGDVRVQASGFFGSMDHEVIPNAVIGGTPHAGSKVFPLTVILPHIPCRAILTRRSSLPLTHGLFTSDG